jgi:hypothetical protein
VSENAELGTFKPKIKELAGGWRKCYNEDPYICTLLQYHEKYMLKLVAESGEKTLLKRTRCRWAANIFHYFIFVTYLMMLSVLRVYSVRWRVTDKGFGREWPWANPDTHGGILVLSCQAKQND